MAIATCIEIYYMDLDDEEKYYTFYVISLVVFKYDVLYNHNAIKRCVFPFSAPFFIQSQADFESSIVEKKQRTDSDDDSFSSINHHNVDGQNRCNDSAPIKVYGRKKRNRPSANRTSDDEEEDTARKKRKIIRPEHILKIAAELLMDFS